MNKTGFFLVLFGVLNIMFPDFIAYIIGGICVIAGVGMLLGPKFGPKKENKEDYVKFGNYKIFR